MRIFTVALFLGCLTTGITPGQQPAFDALSVKVVKLADHPVFGNTGGLGQTILPDKVKAVSLDVIVVDHLEKIPAAN